jgi:hypothetical protein
MKHQTNTIILFMFYLMLSVPQVIQTFLCNVVPHNNGYTIFLENISLYLLLSLFDLYSFLRLLFIVSYLRIYFSLLLFLIVCLHF